MLSHTLSLKFGVLAVLCTLALATLPAAHAQILVDSDCRTLSPIVALNDAATGQHITGVLPNGWEDDSSWQKPITVTYSAVVDGKTSALRIVGLNGRTQAYHMLPTQPGHPIYRLTFSARSSALTLLNVCVRIRPAPYTSLWDKDANLTADWRKFSYIFQPGVESRPIGLYLILNEPGRVDIRDIKLERTNPDTGLGADSMPETHNILRATRFPLGLPGGWSLDRQSDDLTDAIAAPDPAKTGPSGYPSLSVKFVQHSTLYSAPFAVRHPGANYQASAYVAGDFHGQFVVLSDGKGVAHQTVNISSADGWKRIETPFKPEPYALRDQISLQGKGSLWLDALQVEEGDQARPYASGFPAEVSLALPASPTSCDNIQFVDEPAKVEYAVSGSVSGSRLVAQVVNVYGETRKLPASDLGGKTLTTGAWNLATASGRPYGPFRLEAWIESPQGARLSATNEIVFYRLRRPRFWGVDAPQSAFGTHLYATHRATTMAKAIGMNWARLHDTGVEYVGWNWVEPEKGKWVFHDDKVRVYRKSQLSLLGMLSTAPGWATSVGRTANGYFEPYTVPVDMDAWGNYAHTVVQHYKGLIGNYEIWNEPYNGSEYWMVTDAQGKRVRPPNETQAFATLMKTAYAAAKSADPSVNILGFCSSGGRGHDAWNKGVADAGGLGACDVFSYHSYEGSLGGFPGDEPETQLRQALSPLAETPAALGKPVWMSEGNPVNDMLEKGFYNVTDPNVLASDPWDTSNRLARYVTSIRAAGVSKVFLYSMAAYEGFRPFYGKWRTLVAADGSLDPTGAAFSTVAWLIDGLSFDRRMTLAPGVFAYIFAGNGRTVAVLSTAPAHSPYAILPPVGTQALDLFGNPVNGRIAANENVIYLLSATPAGKLEKQLAALAR
ncbi:MAG: hypothetical protein P4L33_16060 [Capsulimonadaceae bacterium]|nr:hypothetical protein [Capsulimonadaceae bacterium]